MDTLAAARHRSTRRIRHAPEKRSRATDTKRSRGVKRSSRKQNRGKEKNSPSLAMFAPLKMRRPVCKSAEPRKGEKQVKNSPQRRAAVRRAAQSRVVRSARVHGHSKSGTEKQERIAPDSELLLDNVRKDVDVGTLDVDTLPKALGRNSVPGQREL